MRTPQDWELMAVDSPYQTAIAVQQLLQEGRSMEATQGLEILIDSMGRSEKRALKSQLSRLMCHILKWNCQPERRSASWSITIRDARTEIADSQEEFPSLNRDYIESIWDKCFSKAVKDAADEMGIPCSMPSLSWQDVFETEYSLIKS